MAEKSSKRPMSLNDSHYRVLQDLSAPPKPSAIPSDNEEEKPSKIKLEGRRHLLKAPSMKDGSNDDGNIPQFSAITDFVSSPVEEEENPVKIEGRRRLCKVSSRDSTIEQDDNIPQFSAITDFDSSSVVEEEKPVKIEGRRRLCKVSSRDSTTEHDDKIPQFSGLTDFDSQPKKAKETKVRVEGRRRLCKVSSRNNPKNGLELDESTFSNLKDFDSPPPPSKNIIERDNNGGRNEIFDILNDLTSRFEFLSVERKRVPKEIQQVEDSSSLIGEKEISKEKIVELPDYESADSSFSPTSSQSDISPDATKSGGVGFKTVDDYEKETLEVENAVDQLNDVEEYSGEDMETGAAFVSEVKKEGRLEYGRIGLNEASKNREPQTHKMNKISSVFNVEDDDNDDCVIVSGRKMESKVQRQVTEFIEEEDDSVEVLDDFVSEDEDSITLSGPRSTYKLLGKIAKMLYPHQRDGLRWLWSLHCQGKGGILGDDMGLGKTMQISGFLAGLFDSHLIRRVLIVAPKTLLPHWVKELSIVGLSDRIREYFGTSTKAREYELQYILQDKGVLLTTYDIVRNNSKSLRGDYYHGDGGNEEGALWDYMILDEGHLIKNPSTQRAKSLLEISSAHRIVISGTPLQNNLKELWALFYFCCPELLGDYKWFKDKFETPILRGNDKSASDREKHTGSTVAKELRDRIQPYFLRRLKSEVFNQDNDKTNAKLSKKNEMIVWLRLTRCQRQLYEAFLKSELVLSAFDGSPLAALTILKKICDHPLLLTKRAAEDVLEGMDSVLNPEDVHVAEKLAMHIADVADTDVFEEKHDVSCKISFVMSLLDNLIPEGHNVLIFSQTRKMLNLIEESLVSKGYGFLRIDGTTKACDRLKIVNDFQDGIGAPIFLLTSQVGGLGLTLTKADRVIVVDPAWNPSTDNQSVDRAYRIGQMKDVLVYRLMTCGTVEEKIYRKQVFKGGLFKTATEHKEQIRYFSQQDLRELFSLPKQGFDVSVTQQQLDEEHGRLHTMDDSLNAHIEFLKRQGIAGISDHSLLFSKATPVQVAHEDVEEIRRKGAGYVGSSSSSSSLERAVDGAEFAFNPKDVSLIKKISSPNTDGKLTESEIRVRIKRLSQTLANKAVISRLPDRGEKLHKQVTELTEELHRIEMGDRNIDLDDVTGKLRVVNV